VITTKIENKNKNNFKMMMENFQNWNDSQDKIKTILENESDEKIWELATCHENEISSLLMEKILDINLSLFLRKSSLLEEKDLIRLVLESDARMLKVANLVRNSGAAAGEIQNGTKILQAWLNSAKAAANPQLAAQLKDAISLGAKRLASLGASTALATAGGSGGSGAAGQGAKAAGQKAGAEIAKKGSAELAKQGVKQGAKQAASKGGQLAVSQGVKQAAAKGGQLALTQAAPQVAARTGLSQAVAKKGLQQLALQGGKQIAARGVLALLGPIGWGITAISIGYSLYQMTQDGEDPKKVVPKIPEPTEAEKQALARQFSANMSVMQRDVLNRNAMLRAANSLNMMEEDIAMAIMYNPKKAQGMIAKLKADEKSMGADGFKEFLEIVEFLNPASMPGAGGSEGMPAVGGNSSGSSGMKDLAKRQAELIRRINKGVTGLNEEEDRKVTPGTEEQSVNLKMLQQSLMRLGIKLPRFGADGDYGRETYKAIRTFQKNNGLKVDGLIGPNTFAKMREKDPKIMSQSATMGANMSQDLSPVLDKVAKAPRGLKKKAYVQAIMSNPDEIKKIKSTFRSKRQEAMRASKEAERKGDRAEANRLAIKANKLGAAFRSVTSAEDESRKINTRKKIVDFASKSAALHMDSVEYNANKETWKTIAPYAAKEYFMEQFAKGNASLRTGALGAAVQIYRTGKDSSGQDAAREQKLMQLAMKAYMDEYNKG